MTHGDRLFAQARDLVIALENLYIHSLLLRLHGITVTEMRDAGGKHYLKLDLDQVRERAPDLRAALPPPPWPTSIIVGHDAIGRRLHQLREWLWTI